MLLRDPETSSAAYRETPINTRGLPPGIPFIIVNEGAERFSFYGMKAILTIFLVHKCGFGQSVAREYYHAFTTAVYFCPLGGALIAEILLGKYRTIMYFSIVYCCGHLVLAISESTGSLVVGLALIAIGAGGIKPCVSAVLGDQFCAANQALLTMAFASFYLAINLGSFVATLVTPALLEHAGSHVAFGVPGVAIIIAVTEPP